MPRATELRRLARRSKAAATRVRRAPWQRCRLVGHPWRVMSIGIRDRAHGL